MLVRVAFARLADVHALPACLQGGGGASLLRIRFLKVGCLAWVANLTYRLIHDVPALAVFFVISCSLARLATLNVTFYRKYTSIK